MVEIISKLYIGTWYEAKNEKDFYTITVAVDSEFIGNEYFKLVDGPGNQEIVFRNAVDAVCNAYKNGLKVLVHCTGGRSKSAAVVVGAIAKLTGRPVCDVYDEVLRKHDGTDWSVRIHPYLSVMLLKVLGY